jgi:hypothetical protein
MMPMHILLIAVPSIGRKKVTATFDGRQYAGGCTQQPTDVTLGEYRQPTHADPDTHAMVDSRTTARRFMAKPLWPQPWVS